MVETSRSTSPHNKIAQEYIVFHSCSEIFDKPTLRLSHIKVTSLKGSREHNHAQKNADSQSSCALQTPVLP